MGSSIDAFIEYDRTLWFNPSAIDVPPFSTIPEAIDLTGFTLFRSGKDYLFFAAISGIRNQTNKEPLYPLRGLPSPISSEVEKFFDPDYPGQGWLTLSEIEAALTHLGFTRDDLSLETNVVLEMMSYLERQLGQNRVRLVFDIE
ncbi:MAG: hypothetical protein AB1489_32040 [Acidobacteriota bacterium]